MNYFTLVERKLLPPTPPKKKRQKLAAREVGTKMTTAAPTNRLKIPASLLPFPLEKEVQDR